MTGLEVSDDERWLEALGVLPTAAGAPEEPWFRGITFPIDDGSELQVSWNLLDASVAMRYLIGGRLVVETYRERVQRLLASRDHGGSWVVVEYGHPADDGRLAVRLTPTFAWTDSTLRLED